MSRSHISSNNPMEIQNFEHLFDKWCFESIRLENSRSVYAYIKRVYGSKLQFIIAIASNIVVSTTITCSIGLKHSRFPPSLYRFAG